MIENLQAFTEGFPDWLQWLGVALIAMVPFLESYIGAAVGVLAGMPLWASIAAASIGNIVSMLIFVIGTDAARKKVRDRSGKSEEELSPKRARVKRMFDRFGVPGVSLFGQLVLPSQITSAAMVGFGASRNAVIFWQILSIILWGVLFGWLAHLLLTFVQG